MPSASVLACPASLKGVLSARDAAAAIARGLGDCDELPLADGGEGTADVVPGLVEAASVIPFDAGRLDPFTSSRPFGELLASLDAERLLVGLGGTANMDGGAGLLEVLDALPPTTVLCDVHTTLYDAPRLYGPQKGATPEIVAELEARFRADASARAVCAPTRLGRGRRARRGARLARRGPRPGRGDRPRSRRLRPGALRARRHRRGPRRRHDARRESPVRGRAALPRRRRALRRLRRPRHRADPRRRDGRPLRRSRAGRRRPGGARGAPLRRDGLALRPCPGPRRASRGRARTALRRAPTA